MEKFDSIKALKTLPVFLSTVDTGRKDGEVLYSIVKGSSQVEGLLLFCLVYGNWVSEPFLEYSKNKI